MTRAPSTLELVRLEGPEDPMVGESVEFESEMAVVGRAIDADLCLPDPTVSRLHATLRRRSDGWYLTDEHSTSGTALNTHVMEPDSPAKIHPGDRIGIGPWLFKVEGDDEPTGTHTVELTIDEPIPAFTPKPPPTSRRFDALSGCLHLLEEATSPEELARAALQGAMDGTGFRRAAILKPQTDENLPPELIAGVERHAGEDMPLDHSNFAPSSSLIKRALEGETAVLTSGPDMNSPVAAHSIVEMAIHSAVCVPVKLDGRVTALMYLDARRGESPVTDAARYCEDIARVYAFAISRDARADLQKRQDLLRVELDRAREIRSMLAPSSSGRVGRYRHASRTIAGLFVSADLFDAVAHEDGSATVIFGDSAGHGVGAAMLAGLVQSHLSATLSAGASLSDAIAQTNRFIALRPTGGRFVSLVAATLRPDGSASLVDAGHGHWLIASAKNPPLHPAQASSYPLGIDPDASFRAQTLTLERGDRLVLYTDGIPEQVCPQGEQFGIPRLNAAVQGSDRCDDDVRAIFDSLQRHAGDRALDDDATVASVQLAPEG